MKKQLMILLFSLIPLIGFTQTITLKDIQKESGEIDTVKVVALIFSEHEKLSIENPLLKEKISALEDLNNLYKEESNTQKEEIQVYKDKVKADKKKIKNLKTTNVLLGISGFVLLILNLL